MNQPKVTNCLPGDRVFYISASMLEERLDVEYYHPRHYDLMQKLVASGYELLKFRDIASRIVDGPFGSEIKAGDYVDLGVPFLRVADVTRGEGIISKADLAFISQEAHERILRSRVVGGDVVIAKTGATMGAASLVPVDFPESNIRADLAAVTLHDKSLALYLVNYINTGIGYQLFWRINSGSTRGRVVIQNLRDYPILLPPKHTRERVNQLISEARKQKRDREAQAKAQLAEMDALLLRELGITPPAPMANTVESRCFIRQFLEVTGGRFSAPSHWKKLDLSSPLYNSANLPQVAFINPPTSFSGLKETSQISFVPMDAISDIFGEIESATTRALGGAQGYTTFQENDLLWAKITPCMENGKSAVARNLLKDFGFGSTEYHIFRAQDERLNIDFLHALLRLQIVRDHARLNFGGSAGHQRVDKDYFEQLEIPLPPRPVQDAIVAQIGGLRASAKSLFAQAQDELDEAKSAIEAMILGE